MYYIRVSVLYKGKSRRLTCFKIKYTVISDLSVIGIFSALINIVFIMVYISVFVRYLITHFIRRYTLTRKAYCKFEQPVGEIFPDNCLYNFDTVILRCISVCKSKYLFGTVMLSRVLIRHHLLKICRRYLMYKIRSAVVYIGKSGSLSRFESEYSAVLHMEVTCAVYLIAKLLIRYEIIGRSKPYDKLEIPVGHSLRTFNCLDHFYISRYLRFIGDFSAFFALCISHRGKQEKHQPQYEYKRYYFFHSAFPPFTMQVPSNRSLHSADLVLLQVYSGR